MSMNDPIADLLTRIRNAAQAKHETCEIPASKVKENIVKILKEEGFISNYVKQEGKPSDSLVVFLKYKGKTRDSIINRIQRKSKPGRRVYTNSKELKPVLGGLGIAIVSTSQGVMTDRMARKNNVGGEILCEVW